MIFSDSPQLRALERMMTAVPRFRPKGGGIMVLHHFEYSPYTRRRYVSLATTFLFEKSSLDRKETREKQITKAIF